jgi:hypothetical protein
MSSVEAADAKEIVQEENEVLTSYEENEVREQNGGDIPEKPEQLEKSEENSMPSSQEEVRHILVNFSNWISVVVVFLHFFMRLLFYLRQGYACYFPYIFIGL